MSLDFYIEYQVEPKERITVVELNITHNLRGMWVKADIYDALYKSHGKKAWTILKRLRKAHGNMLNHPDIYQALESTYGWGTYEDALDFLGKVIEGCQKYPHGRIYISK